MTPGHKSVVKVGPTGCLDCEGTVHSEKMNNLFLPDENSIEQCFAANIVQGCQQYCSTLLHLSAG